MEDNSVYRISMIKNPKTQQRALLNIKGYFNRKPLFYFLDMDLRSDVLNFQPRHTPEGYHFWSAVFQGGDPELSDKGIWYITEDGRHLFLNHCEICDLKGVRVAPPIAIYNYFKPIAYNAQDLVGGLPMYAYDLVEGQSNEQCSKIDSEERRHFINGCEYMRDKLIKTMFTEEQVSWALLKALSLDISINNKDELIKQVISTLKQK